MNVTAAGSASPDLTPLAVNTLANPVALSYFLQKLEATPDGDGSLLDHSLIMYGGGMGNGNLHEHTDPPCLLVGKLEGQLKTGRHLAYPQDTPMANLLLTILDKIGVRVEKFGDSTSLLQPDYLSVA